MKNLNPDLWNKITMVMTSYKLKADSLVELRLNSILKYISKLFLTIIKKILCPFLYEILFAASCQCFYLSRMASAHSLPPLGHLYGWAICLFILVCFSRHLFKRKNPNSSDESACFATRTHSSTAIFLWWSILLR